MSRRNKNRRAVMAKAPVSTPGSTTGPVQMTPSPNNAQRQLSRGNDPSQSVYTRDMVPPDEISPAYIDPDNWFSPFQPVQPFGPPNSNYIREWDYRTGYNQDFSDRRQPLYDQLRNMAKTWGVLAAIIQTRIDQLLRMPWEIQLIGDPRGVNPRVQEMREFFKRPDGKRSFNQWARVLMDNVMITDTPAVYLYKSRGGKPLTAHVIDGTTIKVLIDDAGCVPDYPEPAYQQIIKGLPMNNFTERELLYSPMRPRGDMPVYGYSGVEQFYLEVTEAIRKAVYQLGFWVEGNLPDLLMSVPKEWSVRQIASFQAFFDAELAGNLTAKSKVRFIPDGMKPYDVKNSSGESLYGGRDEFLIRLACFIFSISPQPFVKEMNRATAQTAQETSQQEGQQTLMAWFKDDIVNRIIQDPYLGFGYSDVQMVWQPEQAVDELKRAQIRQIDVKNGVRTINEVRDELGMLPVPEGDQVLIFTNNGVLTLPDAIRAGAAAAMSNPGGGPGNQQDKPDETGGKPSPDEQTSEDETGRERRIDEPKK